MFAATAGSPDMAAFNPALTRFALIEPDRRYLAIHLPGIGAVLHRASNPPEPVDYLHWLALEADCERDRHDRTWGSAGQRYNPVQLEWVDGKVIVRLEYKPAPGRSIAVHPYSPPVTPQSLRADAQRFAWDWVMQWIRDWRGDMPLSEDVRATLEHLVQASNWAASGLKRWQRQRFLGEVGDSPRNFIRRARLAAAGDLLLERPGATVEMIARASGWASPSAFVRAFRSLCSEPPVRWRERRL